MHSAVGLVTPSVVGRLEFRTVQKLYLLYEHTTPRTTDGSIEFIGDRTRGAVMKAKKTPFGSMSVAEILMPDGKSLEKIGVTPDEILLPGSMDLMNRYDPVLSRAFFLSGLVLGADDAGKLLQYRER